jgi:hypothetical protein
MILKLGSVGDDVALLQKRLTRAGFAVDMTHVFDQATEAAVMALQRARGLVVDGIAGPKTMIALPGAALVAHLSDADLVKSAATLGVPVAAVRAVNEVESRGQGFSPDGRPVILFERHVFYARLRALKIDADALAAKYPNIVSPSRGGYMGGSAEYSRLEAAVRLHADAARESASWGAFQIMGYHWQALQYSSIDEFVSCMYRSEAEHLDAFVRFIAANRNLLAALKAKKWAKFAEGYNGADYRANLYDTKLERAYERYAELDKAAA